MSYPKKRKPAGTVECELCGIVVQKRGYRGHLWLKHGLKEGIDDKNMPANSRINESADPLKVDEQLDHFAEYILKQGGDAVRIEYLRNRQPTLGMVDEYSTGKFIFRKKDDYFYSIRRLNVYDD